MKLFCNNCDKQMEHFKAFDGSDAFECDECIVIYFNDGIISDISVEIRHDFFFISSNENYSYFTSGDDDTNQIDCFIAPNINGNIVEVKEYIQRIKKLKILL